MQLIVVSLWKSSGSARGTSSSSPATSGAQASTLPGVRTTRWPEQDIIILLLRVFHIINNLLELISNIIFNYLTSVHQLRHKGNIYLLDCCLLLPSRSLTPPQSSWQGTSFSGRKRTIRLSQISTPGS